MAKKKQVVHTAPKSVSIPPDIAVLEGYGVIIKNAIRNYYSNRPTNLIGTGKRAKRVKGHAPKKSKD